MNQLTFCFEGHNVRFVDGKPVANDVATVLGYASPKDAIYRHVSDRNKGGADLATPGGAQTVMVLEEAGIYQLIFRSKLAIAEKFQDWVFEEVLPSIRKTGSYSLKPLTSAEMLLQQAQFMVELERKQTQLQEEQIRLAVEQQVTKALAEQTNQLALATDNRVNALELELATLKSILNQPIPSCKQTARQRIVEIAQLTADYLYKKGQFASIQQAIKEVWNRINLKIRNSSLKIDLAARKANFKKQYEQAVSAWENSGKPKGHRPLKKNYPNSIPALIESLAIEQPALECTVSVANELVG
jgi:anti-repressor protein